MALIPWRPLRGLDVLRRETDNLWDRFSGERPIEWLRGEWTPSLDVSETQEKVVVKEEITGLDPKETDIALSDGVLTLTGEKKREREKKDKNYH